MSYESNNNIMDFPSLPHNPGIFNPVVDVIVCIFIIGFSDMITWGVTHDAYLALGLKLIAYVGIGYRIADIVRRRLRRKKLAYDFAEEVLKENEALRGKIYNLTNELQTLRGELNQ